MKNRYLGPKDENQVVQLSKIDQHGFCQLGVLHFPGRANANAEVGDHMEWCLN